MGTLLGALSMSRAAAVVLLLGTYAFGLFEIAILPPFEGFDEPGHYSYMQQLAWTGTWPHRGDPMSADVDEYLQAAPTAAAMNPRWSYRDFFAASADVIAGGRDAIFSQPSAPRTWRAGEIPNWEAQHPPLYYALLAPAFRLSAAWSLGAQLLLLRAISYTIAWGGLCLAGVAACRYAMSRRLPLAPVLLAPALWPLLLPMWYPDTARLGNDSLVALLAAGVWFGVARLTESHSGRRGHLGIGLLLGLGLLTKATFLPLTAATLAVLSWRAWRGRRSRPALAGALDVALCVGAVGAVAGWWYLGQALSTGSAIGSNDAVTVSQNGGLLEGLRRHGSVAAFLRMPGTFGLSMVWDGTWSFVSPPFYAIVPMLLAPVGLALAAARYGRTRLRPATSSERLAVLTLVLFTAALVYHSLVLIAVVGGAAPAWYLHSFAPALWPLVAWGIAGTFPSRAAGRAFQALIAYALGFALLATLVQALFFAGCGVTRPEFADFRLRKRLGLPRRSGDDLPQSGRDCVPVLGLRFRCARGAPPGLGRHPGGPCSAHRGGAPVGGGRASLRPAGILTWSAWRIPRLP